MLPLVWTWIQSMWNKVTGYVILAGAVLGALWAAYRHGKDFERNESASRAFERSLESQEEARSIRDDAALEPSPVERVRQDWTRPRR